MPNKQQQVRDLLLSMDSQDGGETPPDRLVPQQTPGIVPETGETVETAPQQLYEQEETSATQPAAETQETAGEEGDGEEGDGIDIEDLSQLAEAIGVEPEWLYNLRIPMPEGGDPITLGEYKDIISQKGKVVGDEQRLAYERNLFEQERQQFQQEREQSLQQLQQLPDAVMQAEARVQALAQQYQTTDWSSLEQTDPGRAALAKQNMSAAFQQAQQEAQTLRYQFQQAQQNLENERRTAEEQKLLMNIESWRDPTIRTAEMNDIATLMVEYDYTPQEAQKLIDSRAIRMMHDYLKIRKQVGTANANAKQVRKVPKALRPAGHGKPKPGKLTELQQTLNAAKTGNRKQKVSAVSQLLNAAGVKPR